MRDNRFRSFMHPRLVIREDSGIEAVGDTVEFLKRLIRVAIGNRIQRGVRYSDDKICQFNRLAFDLSRTLARMRRVLKVIVVDVKRQPLIPKIRDIRQVWIFCFQRVPDEKS